MFVSETIIYLNKMYFERLIFFKNYTHFTYQ